MGRVIIGGRRIKCIRFADDMGLVAEDETILKDMLLQRNDSCGGGCNGSDSVVVVVVVVVMVMVMVLILMAFDGRPNSDKTGVDDNVSDDDGAFIGGGSSGGSVSNDDCVGSEKSLRILLREEHRLRVFENKVLRKIFGAKRDEVTGEWRKLHNAELHALYSSPDIIRNIKSRRLRWAGHVARMGESRNAYRVLVGRPEGKRPLGRPRRRWEDTIKMDLREVGYDDRDWINPAQDRDRWRAYVRAAMNLRVP
ncbi:hypothetical protein ANN_04162 [Periplaneta americana]|uniref:Uncharacterized protein n=1 Tax=Periplaneta americana TaxID=6978 RepID=A0ABQ8TA80_PERAM|nr:hypothetical protein ANN_04162 [Periplaneta americana]